jgi:murein DD-endopeptidase MepM/ murein hydrolase activator NlpD
METSSFENFAKSSLSESLFKRAENAAAQPSAGDANQRRKIAQEFTSFLYLEVLKAMRAATAQDGAAEGDSLSRDMYTAMMDAEVARLAAQRDSTGFSQAVEKSLERAIVSPNPAGGAKTSAALPSAESRHDPVSLQAPASGVISSGFGTRADPLTGSNMFHRGVDIAAPAGAPISAAANGRVVFSGWAAGYGNLVEIDHGDGWVTRYGHNSTNLVAAGDIVAAGQQIASVGQTGRATGDHLHFEVRHDGKPISPKVFLGADSKGAKLNAKA